MKITTITAAMAIEYASANPVYVDWKEYQKVLDWLEAE